IDHQVKIRGVRVEPAEVNSVLAKHSAVAQSVVVALPSEQQEQRLVAYVVPDIGKSLDLTDLRRSLLQELPAAMLPTALVVLDSMPFTPNRKLHRTAPPPPERASASGRGCGAESDELEYRLARLWESELRVTGVSSHSNFFEMGGDSLLQLSLIDAI